MLLWEHTPYFLLLAQDARGIFNNRKEQETMFLASEPTLPLGEDFSQRDEQL